MSCSFAAHFTRGSSFAQRAGHRKATGRARYSEECHVSTVPAPLMDMYFGGARKLPLLCGLLMSRAQGRQALPRGEGPQRV
jgi:hypothetical protein